ncbi:transcriptional modulator of MazE/toxin, MazF [Halothece sp. PCC 7418]|uniref:type II toxin-antitoxin system PemK/MazF family toxin n=1 Tax=Halothece sp. (strain PCC 7418) TaxID=65093 RepID=UPI0002A07650|nr:type II toxin-antitoxin system PemK/MazF family toxin [Halothece sp. PCC 7418]AFZ42889.1 transcriptional modulator of MazE/toxin, MazF [Halothece sp. PCC 7418]
MTKPVLQGEVYLFKAVSSSGDSKKRPWVIVSENIRNQYSRTVLAVPFTSDATNIPPTRVRIPKGEGGLAVDSVAMCDRMTTLKKTLLERGPYGGMIASDYLSQIQEAVLIALGRYS